MLALRCDEIVDEKTGKPVPGKIRELLETVKVLGEACGAQVMFDESADGGMGRVYNMSWGATAFRLGNTRILTGGTRPGAGEGDGHEQPGCCRCGG